MKPKPTPVTYIAAPAGTEFLSAWKDDRGFFIEREAIIAWRIPEGAGPQPVMLHRLGHYLEGLFDLALGTAVLLPSGKVEGRGGDWENFGAFESAMRKKARHARAL